MCADSNRNIIPCFSAHLHVCVLSTPSQFNMCLSFIEPSDPPQSLTPLPGQQQQHRAPSSSSSTQLSQLSQITTSTIANNPSLSGSTRGQQRMMMLKRRGGQAPLPIGASCSFVINTSRLLEPSRHCDDVNQEILRRAASSRSRFPRLFPRSQAVHLCAAAHAAKLNDDVKATRWSGVTPDIDRYACVQRSFFVYAFPVCPIPQALGHANANAR